MKKWLLHIMLISVLGILAASCNQIIDDPIGDCDLDKEKVQITFTLSMKAAAPDSRTWGTDYNPNNIGNEFENQIDLDNLQVLVFNGTTFEGKVNILAYWKVAENIYEFRGELPNAQIDKNIEYKVMVFANCPDVDGNTDLTNLSFVFHGTGADTEYIPMWGVKTTNFTLERFQDLGQINVLRAMAKVEVNLSDALEGYTLEKVQLNANKYNIDGFCLPTGYTGATNTEGMGLEAVFNPKNSDTTAPSGTVALEFEKIAKTNTCYIYIPEYLTTLDADNPSMTVTLMDPNSNIKTYPLEFKYYSGTNEGTSYNIVRNHYYQYTITSVGKTLGFTADIYSWGSATKVVEIIVEDFHWLYVKDKVLYMNNVNEITTTFDSSTDDLKWEIVDGSLLVYNTNTGWDETNNGTQSVDIEKKLNGVITITSAIPNNFVGKEFKVRVWSETSGKSETIQIYQFPPLYVSYATSQETWKTENGQDTKSMYIFKSLLPDLSSIPIPDFDNYYTGNYNENHSSYYYKYYNESDEDKLRWDLRTTYVNYLKTAVYGYPQTTSSVCDRISTTGSTGGSNVGDIFNDVTVLTTVTTDENNRLISPHFMLASQAGMNSGSETSYSTEVDFCQRYMERDEDGNQYGPGVWRVPTKAELCLIDVLQNIKICEVKDILQGGAYWNATQSVLVMLDPNTGKNYDKGAVRCVRDIK